MPAKRACLLGLGLLLAGSFAQAQEEVNKVDQAIKLSEATGAPILAVAGSKT